MNTYETLRAMGINSTYKGYEQVVKAVELARERPERLQAVCKEIYAVVGKTRYYHGTAVERNIRTIARTAYQRNPELLNKLIGYELTTPPTASQFIEALAMAKEVVNEG